MGGSKKPLELPPISWYHGEEEKWMRMGENPCIFKDYCVCDPSKVEFHIRLFFLQMVDI